MKAATRENERCQRGDGSGFRRDFPIWRSGDARPLAEVFFSFLWHF
jgi:hypothetical protein